MDTTSKSQINLTQELNFKENKQSNLTESVKNDLVKTFVRYVLNMMNSKYPIKKVDIQKHVLRNYCRCYDEIFKSSNKVLQEVYGLKLYEIPNDKKQFIVLNDIKIDLPIKLAKEGAKYSLLLIILAHIFMSGGTCSEESIYLLLKELEIVQTDSFVNEHFGNVKTLITVEFPKMLYLSKNTKYSLTQCNLSQSQFDTSKTGLIIEYSWGPRADVEVKKEQILSFVSTVYGRSMKSWPHLYKLILQEKNQEVVEVDNSD